MRLRWTTTATLLSPSTACNGNTGKSPFPGCSSSSGCRINPLPEGGIKGETMEKDKPNWNSKSQISYQVTIRQIHEIYSMGQKAAFGNHQHSVPWLLWELRKYMKNELGIEEIIIGPKPSQG